MANLTKLAKTGAVLTLIGAISLTGVSYVSKAGGINEVIEQLKARALGWKGVAEHNKAEYNKLKAVYDDMLKLLGLQEGASYEQIKAKIDDLVKNADVAGIDNVNDLLYELATSLGVQDQLVKNESTGVYDPQPIYEALRTMEDNLDQAITKIGDTEKGINKEASGDVTYSDDMTLVEKINYLIAQINNANSDQVAIKTTADNALAEVTEATDEDKVTSPVEKPEDETKPSNPGGVQGNAKSEAYGKLTGNAKKLADNGYVEGDLTRFVDSNSKVRYAINNLSKYSSAGVTGDLFSNVEANDRTTYNNVFGANALTEKQVDDLNAWARIPANN